ncbi:Predicted flavoprotein CzcO associated with the cation diffusion facilitator CzcD [Paracoccus halophilus]|uniref:Predicted flavoprotein CzcO associated with the cation diffusion facilitator CzcD n=1 Tax=Paracoccus halophilus TaxID=376733 RepID=A0A1I0SEH4_9RHOB|nr:NAD(P)/FAD-dependent oxidoreductase [Paracoccus halophilus]SFA37890.1 Predicted flavoprotein CzcO associated with the cation diffusion facilitator CzcD [Paracoccus halophilus]
MEHREVVIIGAGISGIDAACNIETKARGTDYVILEGREAIGGTWDLFRYPGIRSDSDMHTFSYGFRPWTKAKRLASAEDIRGYLADVVDEFGVREKIRFGHRIEKVEWDSATSRWSITGTRADGGTFRMTTGFLVMATGYYNYQESYRPDFEGMSDFEGVVADPQFWPEDLDYAGKKVALIGSGATAVTIVPEMAKTAAHVTMIQRSPSYIYNWPVDDKSAARMMKYLPKALGAKLVRTRNLLQNNAIFSLCRSYPKMMRRFFMKHMTGLLGGDRAYTEAHFNPRYNPWDQRLCSTSGNDLFSSISAGKASVRTDHIDRITRNGIRLKSGEEVEADIIVPATGLKVRFFGGMKMLCDGRELRAGELISYRGLMFANVPNLLYFLGYTNNPWTVKADMAAHYLTRLLNRMRKTGDKVVVAELDTGKVEAQPMLKMSSGYVQRAASAMPKIGAGKPWTVYQNPFIDWFFIKKARLNDGVLSFSKARPAPAAGIDERRDVAAIAAE